MIMADVLLWLLVILGSYIVIAAYWLTTQGLAPEFVDACRVAYRRPVRRFGAGLGIALLLGAAGIALSRLPAPPLKLLGVAILLLLLLGALLGSTGLAQHVGRGLGPTAYALQPWHCTFRGGAVLALTFVLPLLGWFIVLPVVLVSGLGAAVAAWRSLAQRSEATSTTPHVPPSMAAPAGV